MTYNLTGNMQTQQMGGGLRVEMPNGGGGPVHWDDIEGRPFGEEDVYFLPETEITFMENDGMMISMFETTEALTVGNTYKVKYGEQIYECEVKDVEGVGIGAGNASMFGLEDTGEPFGFLVGSEESPTTCLMLSLDGASSKTFSIQGTKTVPIDKRYIPDVLEVVDLTEKTDIGGEKVIVALGSIGLVMHCQIDAVSEVQKKLRDNQLKVRLRIEGEYRDPFNSKSSSRHDAEREVVANLISDNLFYFIFMGCIVYIKFSSSLIETVTYKLVEGL